MFVREVLIIVLFIIFLYYDDFVFCLLMFFFWLILRNLKKKDLEKNNVFLEKVNKIDVDNGKVVEIFMCYFKNSECIGSLFIMFEEGYLLILGI